MQIDLEHRIRRGFTLVELLLVMAIMAVLTTMSLALIRKTTEDANVSATQARIRKIESIFQTELERFETRRLPISRNELGRYVDANRFTPTVPREVQLRNLRQRILMDILNCEWPQATLDSSGVAIAPRTDIGRFPSANFITWLNDAANYPNPVDGQTLELRLSGLKSGSIQKWGQFASSPENVAGEYLYEILSQIDFDGMPAIETLGSAIADSDGDGKSELVDAWGEPMAMILVQVKANRIQPEVFEDEPVQWTRFQDATSIAPIGTEILSPVTAPREMQHIRVKVISARLGLQNGWLD